MADEKMNRTVSGNKYFWGSNSFPEEAMVPIFLLNAIIMTYLLKLRAGAPHSPAIEAGMSLGAVKNTILATLITIWAYYNAIGAQISVKMSKPPATPEAFNIATRTVMNDLEQMPPFFLLLWLHCAYIDSFEAGVLGLMYAVCVFLYQLAYSYYGHFTILNEFSTQPRYCILAFFTLSLATACINHGEGEFFTFNSWFNTQGSITQIAIFTVIPILNHFVYFAYPTGMLSARWNLTTNLAKKE